MRELEKIAEEISESLHIQFVFYAENTKPTGIPVCEKQFDRITDDGEYTFFRFLHRGVGYIGVLQGVDTVQYGYATLLPAYIESFAEKASELSKTEYLKRILLGETSSMAVYKYATRYALKGVSCFVLALRIPKLMQEAIGVLEQYVGNSQDSIVPMDETHCALVKFVSEDEGEYDSAVDYAEFLTQSLKEELGIDVQAGVGARVKEFKDVPVSYVGADNALRYADVFEVGGNVHSYREFILVKMLEDIPESKLAEYFASLTDEGLKDVFGDEEMLSTAEAFLQSNLNVSETSRNLYMHRNTLLYRLDKIEKALGLNLRQFSDAVSFRVLTVLHRLLKK